MWCYAAVVIELYQSSTHTAGIQSDSLHDHKLLSTIEMVDDWILQ